MSTETRMEQQTLFPLLTAAGEQRSRWARDELTQLHSLSSDELILRFCISGLLNSAEDIDYLLSHGHIHGSSHHNEGLPRLEILLSLRTAYEQILRGLAEGRPWPSRDAKLKMIHECIHGRTTVYRLLKSTTGYRGA